MSQSVNYVELIGRVGRDPEVRYTGSGKAVCNFTLATDETYKDNNNERQTKTEWHNLVVWGPSVEKFVQPYVHKGDLIRVTGKLQTRSWEDKRDGQKKYTTEINVQDIKSFAGKKSDSGSTTQSTRSTKTTRTQTRRQEPDQIPEEIADDDIPF